MYAVEPALKHLGGKTDFNKCVYKIMRFFGFTNKQTVGILFNSKCVE